MLCLMKCSYTCRGHWTFAKKMLQCCIVNIYLPLGKYSTTILRLYHVANTWKMCICFINMLHLFYMTSHILTQTPSEDQQMAKGIRSMPDGWDAFVQKMKEFYSATPHIAVVFPSVFNAPPIYLNMTAWLLHHVQKSEVTHWLVPLEGQCYFWSLSQDTFISMQH